LLQWLILIWSASSACLSGKAWPPCVET